MTNKELINKLKRDRSLERNEWVQIVSSFDESDRAFAAEIAREIADEIYGKRIYFRGIIEFTNICKNDCLYCGIRRSNQHAQRYRLTKEDIIACCDEGYGCGFRTFVLQGGEDAYFNDDRLCEIVASIKKKYPDCAVTLSVGERSEESYRRLFAAGADRYLLRHETADECHYGKLHPSELSLQNRLRCLDNLKKIGFQTGCGMMVGSPFQTDENIADDMIYIKKFDPQMVGIGPFIPHCDTPFRTEESGSAEKTLMLLSLVRIMLPFALLPATTALGTVRGDGRQQGVLAGCNVVMPNLSPESVRKKYMLYDNKVGTEMSAREGIALLQEQMKAIGYEVIADRGDYQKEKLK